VDLKGFTEEFYRKLCFGELAPVLETLKFLKRETSVWFETTSLLIPGENDDEAQLHWAAEWIAENLGPDVPWHFTAFHPDFKMLDRPPTPPATLTRRGRSPCPRASLCLHRQCPRPRRRQHLLPELPRLVDRARLVRVGPVEPGGDCCAAADIPSPHFDPLRKMGRTAPAVRLGQGDLLRAA